MDKKESKIKEIKETLYKLNFFVNIILIVCFIGVLMLFICAIIFGGKLWLSFSESAVVLIILIAIYKMTIKMVRLANDIEDHEGDENLAKEEVVPILADKDRQNQIAELLSDEVDIASDEEIEELLLQQMDDNN